MRGLIFNFNFMKSKIRVSDGGMKFYNTQVSGYSQAKTITVTKGCAGYKATNTGAVAATVNGEVLYPGVPGTRLGDSTSVLLHENDLYAGNIELSFAAGAGARVTIVQVFYIYE